MSKNNGKSQEDISNVRRKAGSVVSRRKARASRANLVKANKGYARYVKLRRVERQIVENREAFFRASDAKELTALNKTFEALLKEKEKYD